jgi:hypothetical protein
METAPMMTRNMKMRTARKEATTEPLVRRQKPWNCMQMGTQLARRFPEWTNKSTMAATIICNDDASQN